MLLAALALTSSFAFTSTDGSRLAGTLSFPTAGASAARAPAVLLLGANGPEDRDERIGATAVFAAYARALNDAGYAVARYDNRGVGESTTATQAQRVRRQDFVDDATGAIAALAADPHVDAHRVYVLGLSEGAETAMAAALQNAPVRALVLVGPLSVPYAQALEEQTANEPPEVRTRVTLLLQLPYFKSYLGIDPRREITFVKQPLLLLRGAGDSQTPEADFAQLAGAARAAHRRVTVAQFPNDDHFLLHLSKDELASGPQYAAPHELDSAAMARIVEWLSAH